MKIADFLLPDNKKQWMLAKQVGVDYAVCRLPYDVKGVDPFDFMYMLNLKEKFKSAGLELSVFEPAPPNQKIKLGLPGRDEEIEKFCVLLRNMGALGIPVLCYNFMAQIGWFRTSSSTISRGGAMVTSFDSSLLKNAPLTEAGEVSHERLWENLEYFLKKVVPVAEEAKVRLALHPDDPPVPSLRGVGRILTSFEAMKKAVNLVPSEYSGVALCQGTFATMGEDVNSVIKYFGERNKIFLAHFRDIRGTAEKFEETFHDDGQTDMFEAIKAYKEVGYDGFMRVDHVPTMEGEENGIPGYETMGRLFAIGYLKGLLEAVDKQYKDK